MKKTNEIIIKINPVENESTKTVQPFIENLVTPIDLYRYYVVRTQWCERTRAQEYSLYIYMYIVSHYYYSTILDYPSVYADVPNRKC